MGRERKRTAVRWAVAIALGSALATPATATWLRADSKHFVIYSDTSERDLRKQATDLELFDAAMHRVQHLDAHADEQFNKVTVYVVSSMSAVQSLYRGNTRYVAGFYVPRVTGSVAFTPRMGSGANPNDISPRIVLFHEYAHHFLLGNYTQAFPGWFSEGFAEFASTMMEKDGDYWIGAAAQHRAYSLLGRGRVLAAAQLFDPPAKMTPEQLESMYARGWLLTHMIKFDPAYTAPFLRYLDLLNTGTPSAKAATQAFGDLKALDRKIDQYLGKSTIPALQMKGASFAVPVVTVRPLGAGEAAMIRMRMESTRGVDAKSAAPLYARARPVAAKYPTDPVVQGWLAEMAFDANDDAAADAAADAVLATDPSSSQALLYKARVALRRLLVAKSTDPAAWAAARRWIIKANRVQPNDAAALVLFHTSFEMQGAKPSPGAIAGLYRAVDLVPQDKGLRFAAASQRLIDGNVDEAKALLRPLAFDPHAPGDNPAALLLTALDKGVSGQAALDGLRQAATQAAARDD
jgi:hypothetical protein